MTEYIYFVKCPNCEDEMFNFFKEAEAFALKHLSEKPVITQVEVCRNDFGECTDSTDCGIQWSWEDVCADCEAATDPAINVFTLDDFGDYDPDNDPEFDALDNSVDFEPEISEVSAIDSVPDNFRKPVVEEDQRLTTNKKGDYLVQASSGHGYTVFNKNDVCIGGLNCEDEEEAIRRFNLGDLDESRIRKPIPEGMTIEQLVEEMEENEDTVECTWCEELFDKSECRYEVNRGWLCSRCEAAIKSRGETLTFRENTYLESLEEACAVKESFNPDEYVEFEYDELDVTLYSTHLSNEYGYYNDEHEVTLDNFVYQVSKGDVATDLWENDFITAADVANVPGGLEALEDETTWENFLNTDFNTLLSKHYDQLLDYYREYAAEEASENISYEKYRSDEYDDYLASKEDDHWDY